MRAECLKRLKMTKVSEQSSDKENTNTAAVLVPLCINNGKLGLLYTLRSNKVSMNRGQVSFPGGMKDKKDSTLEDTALRETEEELNITKNNIQIWGSGNLIKRKHISVMPVLGFIGNVEPNSLKINKNEVEEAFVQPLEKLCDPNLCRYTQFRSNYTLPTYLGGSHKIWGLTAVITHVVMQALAPEAYKFKLVFLRPISKDEETREKKS